MNSNLVALLFIFSLTSCNIEKKKAEAPLEVKAPIESSPSKKFIEIQGLNPDGDSIRFTDIKSKYILVEFWASWCPPCRQFNPHLVKLYKLYQPRGLEILSISLDHENEKWNHAINKDGLIWPYHISDLGGWESKWALKYGIESIPSNFLLDSLGNVIASNMSHEQMAKTLSTLLE